MAGDKSGNDLGGFALATQASKSEITLPESIMVKLGGPCVALSPVVKGLVQSYSWSTGEVTPFIQLCPEEAHSVSLQARFANGCLSTASTQVVLEYPDCDTLDFGEFTVGTIPGSINLLVDISVANNSGTDLATIFDSTEPPLEHADLGSPNEDFGGQGIGIGGKGGAIGENSYPQGKVLVIAEKADDNNGDGLLDFVSDDPDGGEITLRFKVLVDLTSLVLLDQEENGGSITAFDSGILVHEYEILGLGDNSAQTIPLNITKIKNA